MLVCVTLNNLLSWVYDVSNLYGPFSEQTENSESGLANHISSKTQQEEEEEVQEKMAEDLQEQERRVETMVEDIAVVDTIQIQQDNIFSKNEDSYFRWKLLLNTI